MKWELAIALLFGLAALAQGPKAKPFAQPDGHWWLAANADRRDGFETGYFECSTFLLGHAVPDSGPGDKVNAPVTAFYAGSGKNLSVPIARVIARVDREARQSGRYPVVHPNPSNEYDGNSWWGGTEQQREGMALGFLACQQAEMGLPPTLTAGQLKAKLDNWFGYVDHQTPTQGRRGSEKLGPAILRFEGLKWPPPSDRRQQSETRPTSAGR